MTAISCDRWQMIDMLNGLILPLRGERLNFVHLKLALFLWLCSFGSVPLALVPLLRSSSQGWTSKLTASWFFSRPFTFFYTGCCTPWLGFCLSVERFYTLSSYIAMPSNLVKTFKAEAKHVV